MDINSVWEKMKPVFDEALRMLDQSRLEEGEQLKEDFVTRCDFVESCCIEIEKRSEEIPKAYYEQLCKNVESYTED